MSEIWPTAREEKLGRFLYESLTRADPDPDDAPWEKLPTFDRDMYIHAAVDVCALDDAT